MKYSDNRLKRITRFLYKWLLCSWLHRKNRCHPEVHLINPVYWHCNKCHGCGEEIDIVFNKKKLGWF